MCNMCVVCVHTSSLGTNRMMHSLRCRSCVGCLKSTLLAHSHWPHRICMQHTNTPKPMFVQRPRRRATQQKRGAPLQRSQGGGTWCSWASSTALELAYTHSPGAQITHKQAHRHTQRAAGPLLEWDQPGEPAQRNGVTAGPRPGPRRRRGQAQCKRISRTRESTCGGFGQPGAHLWYKYYLCKEPTNASSESRRIHVSAAFSSPNQPATCGPRLASNSCPYPNTAGGAPPRLPPSRQPISLGATSVNRYCLRCHQMLEPLHKVSAQSLRPMRNQGLHRNAHGTHGRKQAIYRLLIL